MNTGKSVSAHALSPCVSICALDSDTGLCIGCHRSRDEIQAWPRLSAGEKQQLLDELDKRRAQSAAS
jgi:predicted Fe-S protein YdhL (DUF1289 family)